MTVIVAVLNNHYLKSWGQPHPPTWYSSSPPRLGLWHCGKQSCRKQHSSDSACSACIFVMLHCVFWTWKLLLLWMLLWDLGRPSHSHFPNPEPPIGPLRWSMHHSCGGLGICTEKISSQIVSAKATVLCQAAQQPLLPPGSLFQISQPLTLLAWLGYLPVHTQLSLRAVCLPFSLPLSQHTELLRDLPSLGYAQPWDTLNVGEGLKVSHLTRFWSSSLTCTFVSALYPECLSQYIYYSFYRFCQIALKRLVVYTSVSGV